jgi:ribosomal protein S27AE
MTYTPKPPTLRTILGDVRTCPKCGSSRYTVIPDAMALRAGDPNKAEQITCDACGEDILAAFHARTRH